MSRMEERRVFALERIADALEELVEVLVVAEKPGMIITGEAPRPSQPVTEGTPATGRTPLEESGVEPMGPDES